MLVLIKKFWSLKHYGVIWYFFPPKHQKNTSLYFCCFKTPCCYKCVSTSSWIYYWTEHSLLLPLLRRNAFLKRSNFTAVVLIWKYWHHRFQFLPVTSKRTEVIQFFILFTVVWLGPVLIWLIQKASYPIWNNQRTNST